MPDITFHSITLPELNTARVPSQAAEFNTGTSYAVKDYCTYQGVLYRCTTAHAAGGWNNGADFTATNLDNEFDRKLDIPTSSASAPANPREGDLWIDNDEDSAIYNVDPVPLTGSTNAVQSGGVRAALNALDGKKISRKILTGDFSESAKYEVDQLVFYMPPQFTTSVKYNVGDKCTHNGQVYVCIATHNKTAWNEAHFSVSSQDLYRCIQQITQEGPWDDSNWQLTDLNTELARLRSDDAKAFMLADTFESRNVWHVGEYCTYEDATRGNALYKCINDVPNTIAWDPDDWVQVALADDVSDLRNATTYIEESIGCGKEIISGSINGSGVIVSGEKKVVCFAVTPGETIDTISGSYDAYTFYTSKPTMGSVSYNGSLTSGIVLNVKVPPLCRWIAVRILDGNTNINISKSFTNNYYVTPEMFGAVGDGVTDDTDAWQAAVNVGVNVVALSKTYKCNSIEVTRNITIDFNNANFICTDDNLFDIHGSVSETVNGQPKYKANDIGYRIQGEAYRYYTGFGMIQGTNNFEQSRSYYKGGFVGTFTIGYLDGSYPIDVNNGNDEVTVLLINPITVTLKNIGYIRHNIQDQATSIIITYGQNCIIENVFSKELTSYTFIKLSRCLKCECRNIYFSGRYGTSSTNSYIVMLADSSFCVIKDSHIYNKYWHGATTGDTYLCYRNIIDNCEFYNSDGVSYDDHENAVGTIIRDSTFSSIVVATQAIIDNVTIVSQNSYGQKTLLTILGTSNPKLAGAQIHNVAFLPDDNCSVYCGININSYPQASGVTIYYDNIMIDGVSKIGGAIDGKLWFGFKDDSSSSTSYIVKKIRLNECNLTIDLSCSNPHADLSAMDVKKVTYESIS